MVKPQIDKPDADLNAVAESAGEGTPASRARDVLCIHCGGINSVGRKAMSVFCRHCSKRLVVEDFQIKTFHASRSLDTSGSVVVEKRGMLAARVRAQDLTIKGKVQGNIEARGRVEIHRTGEVKGNVTATSLIVEAGALIDGQVCIGRPPGAPATSLNPELK